MVSDCRLEGVMAELRSLGFDCEDISTQCILTVLRRELLNPEQIVEAVTVSQNLAGARIERINGRGCSERDCQSRPVPLCTLINFSVYFFDGGFPAGCLFDAVEQIFYLAQENNPAFKFPNGRCVDCILKRAIDLAKENNCRSVDEFVNFVQGQQDKTHDRLEKSWIEHLELEFGDWRSSDSDLRTEQGEVLFGFQSTLSL